jgi:hypothetical protein
LSSWPIPKHLVQLEVYEHDHGQDVQGVLFGHVPIDLGVVGQGVADGAVQTLEETDEPSLLASLGLGQEGLIARSGRPNFWPNAS